MRNTLLGAPVDDLDIATQLTPPETIAVATKAGFAAHPTGIEHGTITVVVDHKPFEITTLRRDVTTDGRRATVAFTESWEEDAQRRDFRMNALYADASGQIHDPTGGGLDDARAGRVIFIGDAATRIKEDYLRILRFFRFNAWYARTPLDPHGLQHVVLQVGARCRLLGVPEHVAATRHLEHVRVPGDGPERGPALGLDAHDRLVAADLGCGGVPGVHVGERLGRAAIADLFQVLGDGQRQPLRFPMNAFGIRRMAAVLQALRKIVRRRKPQAKRAESGVERFVLKHGTKRGQKLP